MNAYGLLSTQQKSLHYNSDIDIVTFTHRKSPYFSTNPVNNSGSIIISWSLNRGVTWDSTCVWSDGTYLGRYPQGGIYNPPGNTNVNNIHFVATGPVTDGTSSWLGNFYASKSYTDAMGGNPTALSTPTTQFIPNVFGPFNQMISKNFFTYTNDGLVRSAATIYTNVAIPAGPIGTAIMRGNYSAGSFSWSLDPILFDTLVTTTSSGNANLFDVPFMAWDNSGAVGYVVMIGQRIGQAGTPKYGPQPIVYKTTNSGASWTIIPPFDFTTNTSVSSRLALPTGTCSYAIPFFLPNEGMDVTVDGMGRLHLVCTVVSAATDNPDSMFYSYSFNSGGGCGSQNYVFYYNSVLTHPTIFDFILENNNTWSVFVVDSMATEETRGGNNICSQWDASTLDINARIQVSRTDAGDKIFYSWTETDTTSTGHHFNTYPDLYAKGYDIYSSMATPKTLVIGTSASSPTVAQYGIFWHYMSPKIIIPGPGIYEIPFTFSADNTFGGTTPVDHYYISGFQFAISSFSLLVSNTPHSQNTTTYTNVFPNPTQDNVNITFNLNEVSDIYIEICNTLGQVVNFINIPKAETGEHIISIDLSNEKPGVYFYKIKTNVGTNTGKIIKH
ncbi:MAG: T9SS type A sorting domain-containing protein [Bacteroidota bacterium]